MIGIAVFGVALFALQLHHVSAFNGNNLIDDAVFDNANTLNASQIDNWLNANFPNSCISTNRGFSAADPTGYNPSQGFLYGNYVSAGQVIYDAAQAYGLNPQVLLVTLQKEQSLVSGSGSGCVSNDANTRAMAYAAAMGYGCPDSGPPGGYSWTPNPSLYAINGVAVTSVSGTCVNASSKAGFSQQVIHAAWLLKFGEQRSEGNTGWAVIKGNWDNSDDPGTCYGGPMTQGSFKRCSSDTSTTFYDGYTTIDGTSTHMDTGATAALYWYTPHFAGNQNFDSIFLSWFGNIYSVYSWSVSYQYAYTDQTKTTGANLTNLLPGQKVYVGFVANNTGDTTWSNTGSNPVRVGTTQPQDRSSVFCDTTDSPSWIGCNRPALMQEASVAPGQTGTFEFWYKAPSQPGTYDEHFSLVAEGIKWMNDPGLSNYTVVKPPNYSWSIVSQSTYADQTKASSASSGNMSQGSKVYAVVVAKNTGNVSWSNSGTNPVHLATTSSQDRASTFCDSGDSPAWLKCNRPAGMDESSVSPNGTATFEFWYKAPSQPGTYDEHFSLVAEGIKWMNDPGLYFHTAVPFDTSGASVLGSSQTLNAGQSITASNGLYRLAMQSDGNLVIYSINRALWASHTNGQPATKAIMQSDGNLVIYDVQGKPYWASNTAGRVGSTLTMQSDGNLVIYDANGRPAWASNTNGQL